MQIQKKKPKKKLKKKKPKKQNQKIKTQKKTVKHLCRVASPGGRSLSTDFCYW